MSQDPRRLSSNDKQRRAAIVLLATLLACAIGGYGGYRLIRPDVLGAIIGWLLADAIVLIIGVIVMVVTLMRGK
jgi:hypothetical protein